MLEAAVIAAIVVAVPVVYFAAKDAWDYANNDWHSGGGGGGRARPPTIPYVGPGLPLDASQAACLKKAAGAVGLIYGKHGWEAPGIYPQPIGVAAGNQGSWDAWHDQVQSYYASRQDEWANCLTTQPPPASTTSTSDAPVAFEGTYDLAYPSSADGGACGGVAPPPRLAVTGSASSLSFTVPGDGVVDHLSGSADVSYSFVATGQRDVGGGLHIRLLGRFDTDGAKTLIRNGSIEYDGPDVCSWTFTGTRR